MKTNPVLATLSVDDLNQRYRESYIRYKDVPVFCSSFAQEGNQVLINAVPLGLNTDAEAPYQPFDWKMLDITRPESQWLVVNVDKNTIPVHISKKISKQWSRGFSTRTYNLFAPISGVYGLITSVAAKAFTTTPQGRNMQPVAKLLDEPYVQLSSQIMSISDPGSKESVIYLRQHPIAKVDRKAKVILEKQAFAQELKEVLINPTILTMPEVDLQDVVPNPTLVKKKKSEQLFEIYARYMSQAGEIGTAAYTGEFTARRTPPRPEPLEADLSNVVITAPNGIMTFTPEVRLRVRSGSYRFQLAYSDSSQSRTALSAEIIEIQRICEVYLSMLSSNVFLFLRDLAFIMNSLSPISNNEWGLYNRLRASLGIGQRGRP